MPSTPKSTSGFVRSGLNEYFPRRGSENETAARASAHGSREEHENFQCPARVRGCELVIDYKVTDLGQQGYYKAIILVDGNWYVKWMPKRLITATRDAREGRITFEEAKDLVASRAAYRMARKGLPDADGYQRFTYPAPGTYMAIDPLTSRRIKPRNHGTGSITIPMLLAEEGHPNGVGKKNQPIKHIQKFAFASEEWQSYYSMRPLVEASHKLMKDEGSEELDNPARRSGRGHAFQYLASTLAVVSSNLRRIYIFFARDAKRASGRNLYRDRRRKGPDGTLARPRQDPPDPPPGVKLVRLGLLRPAIPRIPCCPRRAFLE
jgi:hypothetical protein